MYIPIFSIMPDKLISLPSSLSASEQLEEPPQLSAEQPVSEETEELVPEPEEPAAKKSRQRRQKPGQKTMSELMSSRPTDKRAVKTPAKFL